MTICLCVVRLFFFSSRRRHTRCALVTGVQTCALPISKPGQVRDGRWLIGLGVAAAFRNNLVTSSRARVTLKPDGRVVVETQMTDIGTGSYTILAQMAAEMLGVPLEAVEVRLADGAFPISAGSRRSKLEEGGVRNGCVR